MTGYRQPDAKTLCKSIYLMHLKSVKSPRLVQGCLRKKKAKILESCVWIWIGYSVCFLRDILILTETHLRYIGLRGVGFFVCFLIVFLWIRRKNEKNWAESDNAQASVCWRYVYMHKDKGEDKSKWLWSFLPTIMFYCLLNTKDRGNHWSGRVSPSLTHAIRNVLFPFILKCSPGISIQSTTHHHYSPSQILYLGKKQNKLTEIAAIHFNLVSYQSTNRIV